MDTTRGRSGQPGPRPTGRTGNGGSIPPASTSPFGEHTWEDLRRYTRNRIDRLTHERGWPIPPADRDDLAGDMILWLIEHWLPLPSSITPDPDLNWRGAIWVVNRQLHRLLAQWLRHNSGVSSVDPTSMRNMIEPPDTGDP